jgi:hypothetical protein
LDEIIGTHGKIYDSPDLETRQEIEEDNEAGYYTASWFDEDGERVTHHHIRTDGGGFGLQQCSALVNLPAAGALHQVHNYTRGNATRGIDPEDEIALHESHDEDDVWTRQADTKESRARYFPLGLTRKYGNYSTGAPYGPLAPTFRKINQDVRHPDRPVPVRNDGHQVYNDSHHSLYKDAQSMHITSGYISGAIFAMSSKNAKERELGQGLVKFLQQATVWARMYMAMKDDKPTRVRVEPTIAIRLWCLKDEIRNSGR